MGSLQTPGPPDKGQSSSCRHLPARTRLTCPSRTSVAAGAPTRIAQVDPSSATRLRIAGRSRTPPFIVIGGDRRFSHADVGGRHGRGWPGPHRFWSFLLGSRVSWRNPHRGERQQLVALDGATASGGRGSANARWTRSRDERQATTGPVAPWDATTGAADGSAIAAIPATSGGIGISPMPRRRSRASPGGHHRPPATSWRSPR
ncbi:hypothetical protein GGR04_003762 [Aureimonas pseudogalii]|uniref:Uncharacterized protein n=1 Tax=Aureimonas pseudogalii TaxID=1744844 RepID=A0A7W6H774_9HYPH|nr:hypothetical protein [Aureimonas pseudogalii]